MDVVFGLLKNSCVQLWSCTNNSARCFGHLRFQSDSCHRPHGQMISEQTKRIDKKTSAMNSHTEEELHKKPRLRSEWVKFGIVLGALLLALLVIGRIYALNEAAHLESKKIAHNYWEGLDRQKLQEVCSSREQDIQSLVQSGLLIPGAFPDGEVVYKWSTRDSWDSLDRNRRFDILSSLTLCRSHGLVTVVDSLNHTLAESRLLDKGAVSASFYPRPIPAVAITPGPPFEERLKCLRLAQEALWGQFTWQTIMKEEDGGYKYYVNRTWRDIPIYQKEKLVRYAGTCRSVGYASFYDGYTGEKLARYLPVLGVSLY